jgi:hypothetical protein
MCLRLTRLARHLHRRLLDRLAAAAGARRSDRRGGPRRPATPARTAANPGGGRVVTYHGWPLYTYLGDAVPGRAAGQGSDDDGGYWYLMRPSGHIDG